MTYETTATSVYGGGSVDTGSYSAIVTSVYGAPSVTSYDGSYGNYDLGTTSTSYGGSNYAFSVNFATPVEDVQTTSSTKATVVNLPAKTSSGCCGRGCPTCPYGRKMREQLANASLQY